MKYTYTALFKEENGKVFARVPDLDGCVTTGKNLSDAIDQITDALNGWLCVAEDENLPIPEPTPQMKIICSDTEILSLVKADTMEYRARTNTKAVRKNISLPAFLADFADRKNINCSQVLQDALMSMF
ncbi:MAG: type II toxin-antitoxin system HicB family antitoxin [Spirochaetaceae bacterium]|nr:type II toxin-antitoxin system HicB family antitoxin [Spirochaetaceae bacterium]MBO7420621.1 type II toxin-antitoxin system HicB family antitoxin [Spirochaetaceae bacterium]MBP5792903.1 type II toxin-antitoxin system HicB family antitoxin [Spirochaetaceae bacterium]